MISGFSVEGSALDDGPSEISVLSVESPALVNDEICCLAGNVSKMRRLPASCKSSDSQYATTDMCSSTSAVRYCRNEGTCTRTYAHKYLWQGVHCQVICTKWPYHRLNDSSTLGSQVLLYQRQHRRRNKCPPAAKDQALRGARLKALLALDFCLRILGCSCKSPGREICHYGYVQEYTGFPYP